MKNARCLARVNATNKRPFLRRDVAGDATKSRYQSRKKSSFGTLALALMDRHQGCLVQTFETVQGVGLGSCAVDAFRVGVGKRRSTRAGLATGRHVVAMGEGMGSKSGRPGGSEKLRLPTRREAGGHSLERSEGSTQATTEPHVGHLSPSDSRLVSLRHHPSLWWAPAALLLAALLPWPYGYYDLLRLAVFVVSAWIAYAQWRHDDGVSGWVVAFGAAALLFNPFMPIHLTREIWSVLNIGTAMLFLGHLRALRRLVVGAPNEPRQLPARSIGRRLRSVPRLMSQRLLSRRPGPRTISRDKAK